jgi:hypothetical protein
MTTLQQFVSADVSNSREGMQVVRMGFVLTAIVHALRGNATDFIAAATAANGKNQKARAYRAAFAAVPQPAKFPYTGKLSAEVSAQIDAAAQPLADKFAAAFLEVCPLESKVISEEDKAKRAAKADERKKADALALAKTLGMVDASTVHELSDLSPTALVDAVVNAIAAGQITGDNLKAIQAACKAVGSVKKNAPPVNHDDKDGQAAGAMLAGMAAAGALSKDSIALQP